MRAMLVPVFGESGAVVAQFLVILIFILILTGVCYWLFRRYYGTAIHTGGRGRSRVPRLGIIDSLAIDHHHRLVLVRRDNVEHLLLIGKTADLVVEPSIIRNVQAGTRPRPGQVPHQPPQQRPAAPHPQTAATPPAPAPSRPQAPTPPGPPAARPETSGISEPIPFPQARRPQPPRPAPQTVPEPASGQAAAFSAGAARQRRNAARGDVPLATPMSAAAAGGASTVSASAHFEEPARPTRVEPAFSLADAIKEIADERIAAADAAAEEPRSEPARDESAAASTQPASPVAADAPAEAKSESVEDGTDSATRTAKEDGEKDAARGEAKEDEDSSAAVSNLEQEMARLLGEITAKRDS